MGYGGMGMAAPENEQARRPGSGGAGEGLVPRLRVLGRAPPRRRTPGIGRAGNPNTARPRPGPYGGSSSRRAASPLIPPPLRPADGASVAAGPGARQPNRRRGHLHDADRPGARVIPPG